MTADYAGILIFGIIGLMSLEKPTELRGSDDAALFAGVLIGVVFVLFGVLNESLHFHILIGAYGLISCWFAHNMALSLYKKSPDAKPYLWGCYNGIVWLFTVLVWALTFLFSGKIFETGVVILAVLFCILSIPGWLTIRRNKWGFIVLSALTFNPIFWIVNGIYIKNRWEDSDRSTDVKSS